MHESMFFLILEILDMQDMENLVYTGTFKQSAAYHRI